ncbi:MAG TPA: hypothetical protein VF950_17875 [Planctomycetota bacterium]
MDTRRDFLIQAAGLPLLLGLPGCSRAEAPSWLAKALGRLREQDAPALLFRLPGDKDGRCALGHSITHYLLNSQDPEVHEVLSEAAVLCLESPVVQDRFRGARTSDTLLLVDGDGYALDGIAFDPGDQWINFVPAARALLHGPGGRRLAERADRARQRATKETLALLARPEVDPEGALIPLLVQERALAPAPRQEQLRTAIEAHWTSIPISTPGPRMPYGVEATTQMKGGCGDCGCEEAPAKNLMVACGMAVMVKNSRYFVKFLKK